MMTPCPSATPVPTPPAGTRPGTSAPAASGPATAHTAARAYDLAAIKFRGVDADINFNLEDYEEDLKQVLVGCKRIGEVLKYVDSQEMEVAVAGSM